MPDLSWKSSRDPQRQKLITKTPVSVTHNLEDAVDNVASNRSACVCQLKDPVDNFAANGRTCTEDGSVA
jgi:hypothetical protein